MAKLLLSCLLLVIALSGCGDLEEDALSSLTVLPSSATVGMSQTKLFSVVGHDSSGIITSVSPSWSVTGGIGIISSTGLFTAGSSTGQGTVVAVYGGKTDSSTVTITDKSWIAGKITGERDAAGVQNVTVSLRGTSYSDTTDSGGDYSVANITAGTYEVYTQENHQIYLMSSEEVTVASGETKTVNFYLLVRPGIPEIPTTTLPSI
ncbi:carboxypeptidase-like regulatory domain-containing protein [Candidatus Margulisiibacteriota bacterium]